MLPFLCSSMESKKNGYRKMKVKVFEIGKKVIYFEGRYIYIYRFCHVCTRKYIYIYIECDMKVSRKKKKKRMSRCLARSQRI